VDRHRGHREVRGAFAQYERRPAGLLEEREAPVSERVVVVVSL
jgi:hypothetical protein